MKALLEGQQLICLFWPDGSEISVGNNSVASGRLSSIEVVMVLGHFGEVPWALATWENGDTKLYNLVMCEGVATGR